MTSRASRPLTVPFVASGTNAGVRTSPCAVRRIPARAREPGSRCRICSALIRRAAYVEALGEADPGARERTGALCRPRVSNRARGAWCALLLGGVDRLRLGACDADLDTARLGLGGLRDPDLEHAVVELRADGVGVDALGQRERTRE